MCNTDFNYILIGDNKMVLCQETEFDKKNLKNRNKLLKTIKKAFPELFKGWWNKQINELIISVEGCRKMFSSQFDRQVYLQENENDWEKNPFVALWIFHEGDKTFCSAKPIN